MSDLPWAPTTKEMPSLMSKMEDHEKTLHHLQLRLNNQDDWLRRLYRAVGLSYPGDEPTEHP